MERPPRKRRAPQREPISLAISSRIDPQLINIDLPPQSLSPSSPEPDSEPLNPFEPFNDYIQSNSVPFIER